MNNVRQYNIKLETKDGAYAIGYMIAQSLAGAFYEFMLMQPFTDDRVSNVSLLSRSEMIGYDAINYPSKMDVFSKDGELQPDFV